MIGPRNTRKDAKKGIDGRGVIGGNCLARLCDSLDIAVSAESFFLSRPFAFFAGLNPGGHL